MHPFVPSSGNSSLPYIEEPWRFGAALYSIVSEVSRFFHLAIGFLPHYIVMLGSLALRRYAFHVNFKMEGLETSPRHQCPQAEDINPVYRIINFLGFRLIVFQVVGARANTGVRWSIEISFQPA
jgi:hypothetical protein